MAGRSLHHEAFTGSLVICPAGVDCSATSDTAAQMLVIGVDPRQVSVAAAGFRARG